MEITPWEKVCQHLLLYLIKYVHDDLISDLGHFCISEAIFKVRAFKFDTNVVDSITFDISSIFLLHSWICNYTSHNVVLFWNERDLIWIDNMINHGAVGGILRMQAFILVALVGSGNGLQPDGIKPLPDMRLTYQLDTHEHILIEFYSKFRHFFLK